MAKPRRTTRQEFYDVFDGFDIEDQATVLEFLQEIHRMARRRRAPKTEPQPAATLLDGQAESEAI